VAQASFRIFIVGRGFFSFRGSGTFAITAQLLKMAIRRKARGSTNDKLAKNYKSIIMVIMASTVGGIRGWLQKVASEVDKEKAREATRMAESRFNAQIYNIAQRIVEYEPLEVSASELLIGDRVFLERKLYEIYDLSKHPARMEVVLREPDDRFGARSFVLNWRLSEKMAIERPDAVPGRGPMGEEATRRYLIDKLKGPNRPEDQLAQWAEQASYQFSSDKANAGESSKNPVLSDSLDPTFSNLLDKPLQPRPLEGPLNP
jgi:hypothetical protein